MFIHCTPDEVYLDCVEGAAYVPSRYLDPTFKIGTKVISRLSYLTTIQRTLCW